jgi:hypothetical protein
MSKQYLPIAVCVISTLFLCCGSAADTLETRNAVELIRTLKVDMGGDEKSSYEGVKDGDKIGEYMARLQVVEGRSDVTKKVIKLMDDQGRVVFTGYHFIGDSCRSARQALFEHLATSSMPLELLMKQYVIKNDGWGDLCVEQQLFSAQKNDLVSVHYVTHFTRKNIAVSLRAVDRVTDVRDVARLIDSLLRGQ